MFVRLVPSEHKWRLVIEWKLAWWLAALWGELREPRVKQLCAELKPPLALWCLQPTQPDSVHFIHQDPSSQRRWNSTCSSLAHLILACFLRTLQTLQSIVTVLFRGALLFLPNAPARKPLPRKIEASFFFKREAQRIASNASPGLLALLPPPPTHRHLHPTGDEGVLALF